MLLVRKANNVLVFLNGEQATSVQMAAAESVSSNQFFFGGHCSGESSWEGRIDEVAIFDRAIMPEVIAAD